MATTDPAADLCDELRPEYDLASLRWKSTGRFARKLAGLLYVPLDADLAPVFPDAAAVNAALRQYLKDHPP